MHTSDKEFMKAMSGVAQVEGGYANNPNDSGGETNWGVTVAVARAYGYLGPMRDMTRDQAYHIYYRRYWLELNLPFVVRTSQAVAHELFDTGVNQGVATAGTYLQRSLNALNRRGQTYGDVTVDGRVGPMTLAALGKYFSARGRAGEAVLLRMLNSLQGARYIELAEAREKDEEFVFGWFANRVA